MGDWIDLLDPSPGELREALPSGMHKAHVEQLEAPGPEGRTGFTVHRDYTFGTVIVAVVDAAAADVFYQRTDLVLTANRLITVRKTTPGRNAYEPPPPPPAGGTQGDAVGRYFYRFMDGVADRYLDVVDELEDEIGELEDHVEYQPADAVSLRIRRLRYQLLHVRRALAPTRDAVRAVADGRIPLPGDPDLVRDLEHEFAGVHDRLLRAADGLELAHDLLVGAREYFQARVAQDQNEIIKRLSAVASLLLVPTFIVGLYGQNFAKMPEFHWGIWGYVWSWALIAAATALQVWYFRRKRWL